MVTAVFQKPFGIDKLGHAIDLVLSPTSGQFRGQAHINPAMLHTPLQQAQHDPDLS
jgi:hypothetical protein